MKRFAVTLAVVGMVMLFATFAVGFYAWAPYASWGGGAYAKGYGSSSSSSGYYPASSSSSGYWPASSSSSGMTYGCCMPAYTCMPASSSSSSGYNYGGYGSSSSSGYNYGAYASSSSSGGYWPASSSSSGWY
ncbi:MAG: hypothetical protein ACLP5H_16165 [Desulfomonilaceae bacterium]